MLYGFHSVQAPDTGHWWLQQEAAAALFPKPEAKKAQMRLLNRTHQIQKNTAFASTSCFQQQQQAHTSQQERY